MNEKMRMFIICVVFALLSSCKNYVNDKASEQSLEIPKQIEQEIKKEFNGLLNILETKDLSKLDVKDTKEIEKIIQELKNTIDKLEAKKTSLEKYREYEEQIKKIKEKLKDKKELEDKLKGLEESLKNKKEERKKALQEAKKKLEEYKKQVDSATGVTTGQQVKVQGQVGQQALKSANELGFKNMTSSSSSDTSNMTKEIIENALKKIEEELQKVEVKKE